LCDEFNQVENIFTCSDKMGNAHVTLSGPGKKTVDKDEVRNGNGITATIQDSTVFPPAKSAMASVDDLTDLQKTLLQESW
jgi:hypothetical protein